MERKDTAMGTSLQFVVYTAEGVDAKAVDAAIDRSVQEIRRLEAVLSDWRDDSDVGRVNQASGDWVSASTSTPMVP